MRTRRKLLEEMNRDMFQKEIKIYLPPIRKVPLNLTYSFTSSHLYGYHLHTCVPCRPWGAGAGERCMAAFIYSVSINCSMHI